MDRGFMASKERAEIELRKQIEADPRKKAAYGAAWGKIEAAEKHAAESVLAFNMIERGLGIDSTLFQIARTLVRMAEEDQKPNPERLREYRDSARASLDLALFSDAPIFPEYEEAKLAPLARLLEIPLPRRLGPRPRPPRPLARGGRQGARGRVEAGGRRRSQAGRLLQGRRCRDRRLRPIQ